MGLPDIAEGMSTPPDAPDRQVNAFAEAPTEEAVSQAIAAHREPAPRADRLCALASRRAARALGARVHQAPMAQAMIFGLLLAQDEVLRGTELIQVADLTDPQTADLTLRFHSEAGDRSSAEKIALFDMAIPTLRSLSIDEYERFARGRRRLDAKRPADRPLRVHAEPDDPASSRAALRRHRPDAAPFSIAAAPRARRASLDLDAGASREPNRSGGRARVPARCAGASTQGLGRSDSDLGRMYAGLGRPMPCNATTRRRPR